MILDFGFWILDFVDLSYSNIHLDSYKNIPVFDFISRIGVSISQKRVLTCVPHNIY